MINTQKLDRLQNTRTFEKPLNTPGDEKAQSQVSSATQGHIGSIEKGAVTLLQTNLDESLHSGLKPEMNEFYGVKI